MYINTHRKREQEKQKRERLVKSKADSVSFMSAGIMTLTLLHPLNVFLRQCPWRPEWHGEIAFLSYYYTPANDFTTNWASLKKAFLYYQLFYQCTIHVTCTLMTCFGVGCTCKHVLKSAKNTARHRSLTPVCLCMCPPSVSQSVLPLSCPPSPLPHSQGTYHYVCTVFSCVRIVLTTALRCT